MSASNYYFFKSFTKQMVIRKRIIAIRVQSPSNLQLSTMANGSNSSNIQRKLGVFSKSSFWADVFYAFLTIGFVANDVEETSN